MRRTLAIVCVLVLFVPSVAAATSPCQDDCMALTASGHEVRTEYEPVDILLYAHIDDLLGEGALNTQAPLAAEATTDEGLGRLTPTIETGTGISDLSFNNNEVALSLSGPTKILPDGQRQTAWHPYLSAAPDFAGDPLRLHWYMSADVSGLDGQRVGAIADLRVAARLETSGFRDTPTIVAASEPSSQLMPTPLVTLPNGRQVYEFVLDLLLRPGASQRIDPGDEIRLIVSWEQVRVGNLVHVAQADWRVHAGPLFPARLIVPMYEPIRVESHSISHYQGKLFLRWSMLPIFGSYDLNASSVRIDVIEAPPGAEPVIDHVILKYSVNCGGDYNPVNSTWSLSYRDQVLPDGDYVLRASILNLQGTYVASTLFPFNVTDGVPEGGVKFSGTASVPNVGAPILFVIVACALVAARRARRDP